MSGLRPRFGVPKDVDTNIIVHPVGDDKFYYRHETTIWVDVGKETREPHKFVAWRFRDGDVMTRAIKESEVPAEITEAYEHVAAPSVGSVVSLGARQVVRNSEGCPIVVGSGPRREELVEPDPQNPNLRRSRRRAPAQ